DPESLLPGAPSYLAAVVAGETEAGVAFLDFSTGQFHAGVVPKGRLEDAIALFRPREVLLLEGGEAPAFDGLPSTLRSAAWFARAGGAAAKSTIGPQSGAAALAAAACRAYAEEVRPGGIGHVGAPSPLRFGERMGLDASAIATLELLESSDGSSERSL